MTRAILFVLVASLATNLFGQESPPENVRRYLAQREQAIRAVEAEWRGIFAKHGLLPAEIAEVKDAGYFPAGGVYNRPKEPFEAKRREVGLLPRRDAGGVNLKGAGYCYHHPRSTAHLPFALTKTDTAAHTPRVSTFCRWRMHDA